MPKIDDKHYVTPFGLQQLKDELTQLIKDERPKLVETVRWAASNGDRSENGDYIYGKKRLREIDRRVRYLTKRIENAVTVDPVSQQQLEQVFFGATISYLQDEDEEPKQVQIVGLDEANIEQNKISYISPFAKAILKSRVGDAVDFRTPQGISTIEILSITY